MTNRSAILFLIVFTASCAGTPVDRGVESNVFSSSRNPEIQIKVSPEFQYAGHIAYESGVKQKYGQERGRCTDSSHFFIQAEGGGDPQKILMISTRELPPYSNRGWAKNLFAGSDHLLFRGSGKVQGVRYHSAVMEKNRVFKENVEEYLFEEGYTVHECYLLKILGKVASKHTLFMVHYMEASDRLQLDGKTYSCGDWKEYSSLSKEQVRYLEDFIVASRQSFSVVGDADSITEELRPVLGGKTASDKSEERLLIKILKPDILYEYGKEKHKVAPGDILAVMMIKTCRGGVGICWKVKNLETGDIGYVLADRMKERHQVYSEPED